MTNSKTTNASSNAAAAATTASKAASSTKNSKKEQDPTQVPRDAKLTSLILQSMDVEDYEERVIPQLLDFSYRYVLDILQDAQLFAEHAERNDIQASDVRIAIEGKLTNSFTYPPSRDVLSELADKRNAQPLPVVPEKFGIRLPPDRHCLTGVNFEIIPLKIPAPKRIKTETEESYSLSSTLPLIDHFNSGQLKPPVVSKPAGDGDLDMPDIIAPTIQPVDSLKQKKEEEKNFDF